MPTKELIKLKSQLTFRSKVNKVDYGKRGFKFILAIPITYLIFYTIVQWFNFSSPYLNLGLLTLLEFESLLSFMFFLHSRNAIKFLLIVLPLILFIFFVWIELFVLNFQSIF